MNVHNAKYKLLFLFFITLSLFINKSNNYILTNFIDRILNNLHLWTLLEIKGFLVFKFFTYLGDGHVIFVFLIILGISCWIRNNYRKFVFLFIIFTSSKIINEILKNYFERPRPTNRFLINAEGWSFPSGHTMNAASFYLGLLLLGFGSTNSLIVRILILCIIIMVGLSRIALGVHYATDVIGGWFIGYLVVIVGIFIINRLNIEKENQ
ncbi:MAG: phosphatase family protein [Bacillales bacterium]|jgi:undecaprenyl-diphosphatase|nr:phosphatase family protein [Bacillales bacterium]